MNPSLKISTSYETVLYDPCEKRFDTYLGQTTHLLCEFEYDSDIDVTAITWSRQLPDEMIETFYSNGVFHADKGFVVRANHSTTEHSMSATRFEPSVCIIGT